MTDSAQPYRVLARKYRPQTFDELIGQDAMVQTLANAIRRDRIAHAFLMTGVRGVGKTTTARLIAKALNCIGPDGDGGPTIDPCGICEPCKAIAEGRHIDVIEMDAASHTGIDDIREIIDAVRYAAVSARYKVYIIDEVHMLSKAAFNGLLKTLEEPPPHVKFIFATTEVNKLPVTVLSRCQRFDLRRITVDMLETHFAEIVAKEACTAEGEALHLIAVAAEGSVRDGLSILDQAISHADLDGDGKVTAAQVRAMLGLSDRGAVRRLFGHMIAGETRDMLGGLAEHYALGAEPLAIVRGLLDLTHQVTLTKVGRSVDPGLPETDRAAVTDWAGRLGYATLHRLWQLLLKAHDEVARAAMPLEALEMAALRICYAATMPDPGKLAQGLAQASTAPVGEPPTVTPDAVPATVASADAPDRAASAPPVAKPDAVPANDAQAPENEAADVPGLTDIVELLWRAGQGRLAQQAHDFVRPIAIAADGMTIAGSERADDALCRALAEALSKAMGRRWTVAIGDAPGEPSLLEREQAAAARKQAEIMEIPVVKAAFDHFPGARLLTPQPASDRKAAS
ncbi:MAG: DNA polymerase III subunit gamma/tau [Sphingomonadales bacterium]|nr:DNA polymerase III subunit gamma/tau [Sphingomonadales bacterium]